MKTLKPLQLSLLHRCFELRGRKLLGVSVLAFLTLEDTPTLLLESQLWPFLAETLGKDAALESGMPKAVSEFLVFGSAYAPNQQPAPATAVRAHFGSLDKILLVYGDRHWNGRQPTEPVPFTSMPLDWSRSFGGPAFPANPSGKGMARIDVDGRSVQPLPNVEYPGKEVRTPSGTGTPAGFGLVDLAWPQRSELVGTYDDAWLKTRFPGLADDIDWRHFNVAPRDQWQDDPIAPDEAFEFRNLHQTHEILKGRLPGMACRAFVNRRTDRVTLEEVKLTLRTAAFFPDRERVVLIWQGTAPIADEQAADIVHIMVGADQASAPRSTNEYRAVFDKRLDKEKGPAYALKDSDLTPRGMRLAALTSRPGPKDPSLGDALERAEKEIQQARTMVAGYGLDPDKHAPVIPDRTEEAMPALEDAFDFMEKKLAEAQAVAASQKEWADREDKALAAIMSNAGHDFDRIVKERTRKPVGPPQFSAKTELDGMREIAGRMQSLGQPVPEIDAYIVDANYTARLRNAEEQMQAAYRLTAHHQTPAPRMATDSAAGLKEALAAEYAAKGSFAGRDLTGADLSGLDLHGADFSGALLESADLHGSHLEDCNFSGAVLAHATLNGAVLDRANLAGANLGGANLGGASLGRARLADAILSGADLAKAVFTAADLSGADLTNAKFDQTDFSQVAAPELLFNEVDLRGIILRGARMQKTVFIKCNLAGADLSGADFSGSAFVGVNAVQTRFERARLGRCCFVTSCDLSGADFRRADLSGANLRDARLKGAAFNSAVLQGCDLSGADLRRSIFYMADARNARFVKADLSLAVFASANLLNAVLERSVLHGADLRHANLFQSDLARVRVDEATRWDGSYSKRARTYPRFKPGAEESTS